MNPKPPTTRRELMKPAQLFWLALAAGVFMGFVVAMSMGAFEDRFPGEGLHALLLGLIWGGITFVATIVVIVLLLMTVKPSEIAQVIDKPVLVADEKAAARIQAERAAAAEAKKKRQSGSTGGA